MQLRLYQEGKAKAEAAIAEYEAMVKNLQQQGMMDENGELTQKAKDLFAQMERVG